MSISNTPVHVRVAARWAFPTELTAVFFPGHCYDDARFALCVCACVEMFLVSLCFALAISSHFSISLEIIIKNGNNTMLLCQWNACIELVSVRAIAAGELLWSLIRHDVSVNTVVVAAAFFSSLCSLYFRLFSEHSPFCIHIFLPERCLAKSPLTMQEREKKKNKTTILWAEYFMFVLMIYKTKN